MYYLLMHSVVLLETLIGYENLYNLHSASMVHPTYIWSKYN